MREEDDTNTNALDLPEIGNTPLGVGHGIGAIALNMAIKYHDSTVIKDGALYQQRKLEGANFQTIDLSHVLETAKIFERHIITAPNRISDMIINVVAEGLDEIIRDTTGEEIVGDSTE